MTLFNRIRTAFASRRAQPVWPNVSAEQYAEDRTREAVNVLRSVGRIVQIGPHKFSVVAEDFGSILDCEKAASRLVEILRTEGAPFRGRAIIEVLDDLADRIREELGISEERILGCCFCVEPV